MSVTTLGSGTRRRSTAEPGLTERRRLQATSEGGQLLDLGRGLLHTGPRCPGEVERIT